VSSSALGRDRSGQLLEPRRERRLVVADEVSEEQLAQEVQQVGIEIGPALQRALDRAVHEPKHGERYRWLTPRFRKYGTIAAASRKPKSGRSWIRYVPTRSVVIR
jgi:hypothetical protein